MRSLSIAIARPTRRPCSWWPQRFRALDGGSPLREGAAAIGWVAAERDAGRLRQGEFGEAIIVQETKQ